MNPTVQPETKNYRVTVKRLSQQKARAETHGQTLDLAIKGGDPALGFTAPETLLAAFGACILSNVNRTAAEMGLRIEEAQVEFDGVKHSNPLGIDPLRYRLTVRSPEPADPLQEMYRRATTDGTATNMLLNGVKPESQLEIQPALKA